MAQNRYITVNDDGSLSQDETPIGPGDKVHWQPESDDTVFEVSFPTASPVEFRQKKNQKGKPLVGKVNNCVKPGERFPFSAGTRVIAQPELIVDGRRFRKSAKRKRAKR